ncbi:MAG: Hsp70 family protein [Candidatus Competibacteraceae bacterium]
MSIRCGIDLGTTYSAISWYDADNRRVETIDLEHADGHNIIPSVVYFEAGGNIVVGEAARNANLQHSERVLVGIKRSMGEDYKTPPIDGREYTPQEISAEILKVLKTDAEQWLGEPLKDVVISVPAYFGDRERLATQEAAQLSGLNVLELIPEPHAAALAFAVDRVKDVENRNILVYDLGGGTFDVTLIMTEREELEGSLIGLRINTLAKEGNRQLGGLDWDRVLARLVADKAMDQYGIADPHNDAQAEATLMKNCEAAKRSLSQVNTLQILADLQGHQVEVTRSEFEEATRDLVLQTEFLLEKVLEEVEKNHGLLTEKRIQERVGQGTPRAELEAKKVRLLLCGGATRMPMVKDCVSRVMGEAPLQHKNPDLLVTVGAAYHAYLLGATGTAAGAGPTIQTRDGAITLLAGGGDIGKPIGVEVVEVDNRGNVTRKQNVVIIRRGAQHNEVFEQEFGTAFAGMTEIPLVFYEGDSPEPEDCTRLADVTITGLPPGRSAGRPVKVRLWYDHNGIVCGQAIDLETRQDVEIKIERWS